MWARERRVWALGVRVELPLQPLVKLPSMEVGVSGDGLAGRAAIVVAPHLQQGVRLDENGTVIPDLEPFPFQQGLADIAYMAVARIGLCGQIGDAPCSIRVAQQDAQDGCRLRGEDGAQRTGLGAGLVCDGALNVDGVEHEPRVPGQIEVGDIVVGADGARLRRRVGADKHGNEAPAAKCFTGLAQSRTQLSS